MAIYKYSQIKKIAEEVKLKFLKEGIFVKKKARKKPRDEEKLKVLYLMAINRLKKYKPKTVKGKIHLPYFKL